MKARRRARAAQRRSRTAGTRSRSARKRSQASDYVDVAIAYAQDALADRRGKRHGPWIRLAAKRFLKDLKRARRKSPPFYFSRERANLHCEFVEGLPHVEGNWSESNLIKLHPAHVFFLVQLFGFRSRDGGRRFTTALFAVARKNAKSLIAAAIGLSCLCLEPEVGPQILSAATTGQQARKVFDPARLMVTKLPELRDAFQLEAFSNAIARYENGGTFKPVNAKASSQDGWNPSVVCVDEVHAHKTHDLINVLSSAAGGRANPLWLYTTTEGYETPGPWPELRQFAMQVLEGVLEADHFLALLFMLDEKDDDFDESKWRKANPLIDVNPHLLQKMREAAIDAKAMPGKMSEFRIKRLNRQASSAKGVIKLGKWKRCGGPVPLDELVGVQCWGAIDLAATTDMNAWRLLWLRDGVFYTWGRYWVPEEAVQQRTERRTVPYAAWIEKKLLIQTPGAVSNYEIIERDILEDCGRFKPEKIAFDPWNATEVVNFLTENGQELELFIQGPKSYQPAWKAFETAYVAGNLRHGSDAVLTWNASNLVPRYDANMNFAPDRKRAADKIDGICALLMAFGLAAKGATSGTIYDRQEQLLLV